MTDLDVLEKLNNSCGVGNVVPLKKRKEHWKDAWIWRVSGDKAAMVMEAIKPHMGQRRKDKIDTLLSDWYAHRR